MRLGWLGRCDPLAAGVWIAMLVSIAVLVMLPLDAAGWDLDIYKVAIVSLRQEHDPYLDAMAVQRAFHATLAAHPNATTPYSYVYSPITLPLLRWVGRFPFPWSTAMYWMAYVACVWSIVRVGLWMCEREERRFFAVLAPISSVFPGLLHHDSVLSGNVAFLCYGAALGAAWLGWRRGVWWPFYVAVVAASCFKAPLLSLIAIPLLSARRQAWPAGGSALAGVALFAVQPRIWPAAFHHYLEAVDLQFLFNRDFGSSPAGVVSDVLFNVAPYRAVSPLVYIGYAIAVAATLFWLSRRYLEGLIGLRAWLPVMLVGVILLNPRLMEYDLFPVALPMGLVLWRLLGRHNSPGRTLFEFALATGMANAFAINAWKPTECVVLVVLFAGGAADLVRSAREGQQAKAVIADKGYDAGLHRSLQSIPL